MKIQDLFAPHLEYRAKMGNTYKTLTEIERFLTHPIQEAVGHKELSEIKVIDTANVMEKGRKYGIYGEQRAVCYFRALLKWAKDSGMKVPFEWYSIRIPKVPEKRVEYLSAEEIEQVRSCFDTATMTGLRTRALIELLLDTGLRIGEACGLNRADLNFETLEIQVLNIKTKEWGKVYMTDRSAKWIRIYLENREDDHQALFISGRARMLPNTSKGYIRTKIRGLNLPKKVCHHVFRRTLGTTLAHEKVDIKTVKEILRHKSSRTTERYYIGTNDERSKQMHNEIASRIFG